MLQHGFLAKVQDGGDVKVDSTTSYMYQFHAALESSSQKMARSAPDHAVELLPRGLQTKWRPRGVDV